MMNLIFILIFSVIFFILAWRRFEWGVFLLFLLLPTYLIRFHLGPIPSTVLEVMILSLIVIWCLKISRQKNISLSQYSIFNQYFISKNKLLSAGIILFLLGATISLFTAVDIKKAVGEWRAFYVEPVLLFFVLTAYLKNFTVEKRKKIIENFILFPLILCGFITSLLAIYQHFTGWLVPHAFWANRHTYRVTGWYGFPNAVGLFLAPIVPLALYMVSERITNYELRIKDFKNWKLGVTLLCSLLFLPTTFLALLFTKGSGAIIGVLGGIGLLLLFYQKTRLPAIIIGIVGIMSIVLLPPNHSLRQELLFQNRPAELRLDMWKETKELLKDRPVWGAGLASYEERIVPYRQDKKIEVFHHPHNLFLTIWVNVGIIGLIGFFLILLWCFAQLKNKTQETKYLVSGLVVFLVMGIVDSPYIKNDLAILFWLIPTLLLSKITPPSAGEQTSL